VPTAVWLHQAAATGQMSKMAARAPCNLAKPPKLPRTRKNTSCRSVAAWSTATTAPIMAMRKGVWPERPSIKAMHNKSPHTAKNVHCTVATRCSLLSTAPEQKRMADKRIHSVAITEAVWLVATTNE